jgi:hypothetical protein
MKRFAEQPSRCGARTRSAMQIGAGTGRRRCRMHGGADGSAGPKGARNGNYRHGRYTEEVQAEVTAFIQSPHRPAKPWASP